MIVLAGALWINGGPPPRAPFKLCVGSADASVDDVDRDAFSGLVALVDVLVFASLFERIPV